MPTSRISLGPWCLWSLLLVVPWLVPHTAAAQEAHNQAQAEWPQWSYRARLAGTFFEPGDSGPEINSRLQSLVDDNVSVVLFDAPTGWDYTYWEDDALFQQVLSLVQNDVVPRATVKGLKTVWYLTGLELICVGCQGGSTPGTEHPDWMQMDIQGNPVDLNASNCTEFWLEPDDVDSWASPESSGYRSLYASRIRDVASSGVDAIWIDVIYLMDSICDFSDLWPSHDAASQSAFEAAYPGATTPTSESWGSLDWRYWIRWRYESIRDFIQFVFDEARDANPNILCLVENWNMDTTFTTRYAQDPTTLMDLPHISTADELCSVDQDNGGMGGASIQDWRDYALMAKFSTASDHGAPSWILTYAQNEDLSRRVAGVMVAEKACFYETKGPDMLNTTAGGRANTLAWIRDSEDLIYGSTSAADIAVWYSPESRDYVDQGAEMDWYDYSGTTYIQELRARQTDLLLAWMPFDMVMDEGLSALDLARYPWLVLPDAACLSDAEAAIIQSYALAGGKVAVTLDTGDYDEWFQPRVVNALSGITTYAFSAVTSDLLTTSLGAAARGKILAEVSTGEVAGEPYLVVSLVNLDTSTVFSSFTVGVRLPQGFSLTTARLTTPDGPDTPLAHSTVGDKVNLTVPALDTASLLIIEGAWGDLIFADGFELGDTSAWSPKAVVFLDR